MQKVLLLENINPIAAQQFEDAGFTVELINKSLPEEELLEKIKEITVLGIRSATKLTAQMVRKAASLKVIGTYTAGFDNIDSVIFQEQLIPVFNAPSGNTLSVIEMVIGEIIMLSRRIVEQNQQMQQGIWNKSSVNSHQVRGRKLGIVGYGNIGSQIGLMAEVLGMEVYYYDAFDRQPIGKAQKCDSLEQLLNKVDVVSIHVFGGDKTRNFISEKEFSQMKDGVIFLNFSRGSVVDTEALVKYLKNGKIAGAGIDVFVNEPISNNDQFKSDLQGLPNVILTPHTGGSTQEAQEKIAEDITKRILNFLQTGDKTGIIKL